jgi:hypothetical protein
LDQGANVLLFGPSGSGKSHAAAAIHVHWPRVEILLRGDSHYARHEAMAWCEHNRVAYVFGLAGNQVLSRRVADLAEDAAVARIEGEGPKVRRFGEFPYAAKTWQVERRVIARVEASAQGSDSRFVVTNLRGAPRWLYEGVYCQRGQAENLIKAHKLHLASDRTSCTSATANQFRLLIHTAAYWLLNTLRGLAPKTSFWRDAQFDTIRLALIKVAARVTEMKTRIKVALPTAYPNHLALLLHRDFCQPAASRPANSHCDSGPASRPIRDSTNGCARSQPISASGSLVTFASATMLPVASTMQTLDCSTDTSIPA